MDFMRSTWRALKAFRKNLRNGYWRSFKGGFARHLAPFPLDPAGLTSNGYLHEAASYSCPILNPPGQERLFENKLHNLGLALSKMQGLMLEPGDIFSFWRMVGPPDEAHGYREGAQFLRCRVTSAVGGGLCQLSGLLHNLALLSGCRILERHNHSIDAYGENRYIPLGRDATVAYPLVDLCFQNPWDFPLLLKIEIHRDRALGWMFSTRPLPAQVEIETSATGTQDNRGVQIVQSWRKFQAPDGSVRREYLFESLYQPVA